MVNLSAYFQAWKQRLDSLQVAFGEIKALPKDARHIQALVVCNACRTFITELEAALEVVLADEICRRDELFLAAVDEIHLVAFEKKPWPLGQDVPARLIELKQCLNTRRVEWADQSAHFEQSASDILNFNRKRAYDIIGQLAFVYGLFSPD